MNDDIATRPFRERCEHVFNLAFGGAHHVHSPKFVGNDERCEFRITGELATWDFNTMTALVVAGHDAALRISVSGGGPRKLLVILWPRTRWDDEHTTVHSHPTLEDHVAFIRGQIDRNAFYARCRGPVAAPAAEAGAE